MTRTLEIAIDCTNIPAGWPRAYYMDNGERQYTQFSSARAIDQIFACSTDRLYTLGKRFGCSSCGEVMKEGLLLDLGHTFGAKPDVYDGHYGSPICFRCMVFAMKHCPKFAALQDKHGDDLQWVRVLSPSDYVTWDETGVIVLTEGGKRRKRITTGQIRARLAKKDYALTGVSLGDNIETAPKDY